MSPADCWVFQLTAGCCTSARLVQWTASVHNVRPDSRSCCAAITIVNGDKLCYIATQGCPCFEQDRQLGLCAWSFMSRTPEAMVIEDTLQDAR